MAARENGRFGRLFGRDEAAPGEESVPLSGNDDHAWWADRRTLAGAPGDPHTVAPSPDEPQPHDEAVAPEAEDDSWSVEALFADAGFNPAGPSSPPPPPLTDDGTTTVLVTTGLDEARLVLGVSATSSWSEITKAHRALVKQFHPDRLGDLSPDAQELGQHRMAEINRAYDTLREFVAD